MQLFVLGMHRSGTSALSRILNLMGVYFGGESVGTGHNAENARGFWERRDVRDVNDTILFNADCDWDCVSRLDVGALPDARIAEYSSLTMDIVMAMDAHRPWFLKEPRLCVLFPIWRQVVDLPVCIHIYRNPLEVAHSLQTRNGMPIEAGLALWELYNLRALQSSAGLPRIFVRYEDLLMKRQQTVLALYDELSEAGVDGLRVPREAELSFAMDDRLRHERQTLAALDDVATTSQKELFRILCSSDERHVAETVAEAAPSAECLEVLRRYEANVDVFSRRNQANKLARNRSGTGAELRLTLKGLELDHATRFVERATKRIAELERQTDAMRDSQADLRVRLELSEQTAKRLDEGNTRLELEKALLDEANARLEHEIALLDDDNVRLDDDNVRLDDDNVRLDEANARHQSRISNAAQEASTLRDQIKQAVAEWDVLLAHQKARIADLRGVVRTLDDNLHSLLCSRRWRLGNGLVALVSRLALRHGSQALSERRLGVLAAHEARGRSRQDMAADRRGLVDRMVSLLPGQTRAVQDLIGADETRDAQLARKLVVRQLLAADRNREIAELGIYISDLIALIETLRSSRRWRVGDYLLSRPAVIMGRGKSPTALDAAVEVIEGYRRDPAAMVELPNSDVEERNVVPPPEPAPYLPPNIYRPAPDLELDIVVCIHNALDHAERCLASLVTRTTIGFRLLVVNDGSDEATTARLRSLAHDEPRVEVIETNGPLGYTCAANIGLRASTAAFVVLMNSDTIVPRLWAEGMLECMASDRRLGIVGPLSNAASWQSVPKRYDDTGTWTINELPGGYSVDEFAELVYLTSGRRFPHVDLLNGFCLMVRRAVLEQVGYLDEATFPRGYGEENDYCFRARDAGFELAIADHCYVYHAKSKSFGRDARDALARDGDRSLKGKYGTSRIESSTGALRNSPVLSQMRAALRERPTVRPTEVRPISTAAVGWRILFVLPAKGGSGGTNSVVQEAAGMCMLGVYAQVAVHVKYKHSFELFYKDFHAAGMILYFESDEDLFSIAASFHVIVATLWSTPALIAPIQLRSPEKLYVYYVQDYEPWFFPDDPESRDVAERSYTLLPDMTMMAKTDWICRTISEYHGRTVYRVTPSLDHHIYYPLDVPATDVHAIGIAAMVRPSTPRRAPLRTLRVLKDIAARTNRQLRILTFGCESVDLRAYVAQNAPSEDLLDFTFENRGLLTRDEVADLLRSVDIFIDLSDYQAFGRTGLEAMACGCAVVLPASGGVYEYAVDRHNARIVDTRSVGAAVVALQEIVEDDEERRQLQKHAIATASKYDILRASLSELSVFHAAWALKNGPKIAGNDIYGPGIKPFVDDAEPAKSGRMGVQEK